MHMVNPINMVLLFNTYQLIIINTIPIKLLVVHIPHKGSYNYDIVNFITLSSLVPLLLAKTLKQETFKTTL